jgi:hypothetical protein
MNERRSQVTLVKYCLKRPRRSLSAFRNASMIQDQFPVFSEGSNEIPAGGKDGDCLPQRILVCSVVNVNTVMQSALSDWE